MNAHPEQSMKGFGKLVLIADDYDHAAQLIADLLELTTPHTGIAAKDGQEALERAVVQKPDVCLLDLDMPRMGGMATAKAIRGSFQEQRPLLVGMTSGGAYLEAVQSGLFDDVISKPLDMIRLAKLIARA